MQITTGPYDDHLCPAVALAYCYVILEAAAVVQFQWN